MELLPILGFAVTAIGGAIGYMKWRSEQPRAIVKFETIHVSRDKDRGKPGPHPMVQVSVVTIAAVRAPIPVEDIRIETIDPENLDGFGQTAYSGVLADHAYSATPCDIAAGTTKRFVYTFQATDPPSNGYAKARADVHRTDTKKPVASNDAKIRVYKASEGNPFYNDREPSKRDGRVSEHLSEMLEVMQQMRGSNYPEYAAQMGRIQALGSGIGDETLSRLLNEARARGDFQATNRLYETTWSRVQELQAQQIRE